MNNQIMVIVNPVWHYHASRKPSWMYWTYWSCCANFGYIERD